MDSTHQETTESRLLKRHSSFTEPDLNIGTALLRRTSSFGGGPIVLLKTPTLDQSSESATKAPAIRWMILFLACCLLFGNFYAYDNPAALNIPLQNYLGHDYDTWQYELNLMYSVYSLPNMFIPLIGGALIDSMNPAYVLMGFSFIVCLGQTIFAIGVSTKWFSLMLIGRILFGIGGETISVAQASITTRWFSGKELSFALGLNLCIARLGSVCNSILSPRLDKLVSAPFAVWIGSLMCYLSLISAFLLTRIMTKYPTQDYENHGHDESIPKRESNTLLESNEDGSESEPLLPTRNNHSTNIISDCMYLPTRFWFICIICILLYGTVVPFNNIASDFLMSKWYPGDTETAGAVMSIPDSMSAFLVPFCGVIVDYYGGRASFLLLCSLIIMGVHLTLALSDITPIIPLLFLGLSYSMYGVAIWPSIATVIEHQETIIGRQQGYSPKLVGTGFGISTSALNTALTIFPMITAGIRVDGGSFVPVELFFSILAFLGAIFSAILWYIDVRDGSVLQRSSNATTSSDPWALYERIKVVGRGAHGFAILCNRKKDNVNVVVKELLHDMKSKEAHDEYMNEIQLLSIVRHPNIIAYFDSFTAENKDYTDHKTRDATVSNRRQKQQTPMTLYIVMEYADGGTLDSYLNTLNGTHLSEPQVIYFFSQIAFALHHIHSHNILHRDLKTNNIMISGTGKSLILKIGDFGISKFLSSQEATSVTVVGTPSYLSPELCDGKSCNEKSDIWAMGCILYEIMALHRMFEGSSLPALVMKITSGKYKPLPSFYSSDLSSLVGDCTRLNPDDRPNTQAIMGMCFLQEGLLSTQMTIGRLSLVDECNFIPIDS